VAATEEILLEADPGVLIPETSDRDDADEGDEVGRQRLTLLEGRPPVRSSSW